MGIKINDKVKAIHRYSDTDEDEIIVTGIITDIVGNNVIIDTGSDSHPLVAVSKSDMLE